MKPLVITGVDLRSEEGRDSVSGSGCVRAAGQGVKTGRENFVYALSLNVRLPLSNTRRKLRGFAGETPASASLKSQPSMNIPAFLL